MTNKISPTIESLNDLVLESRKLVNNGDWQFGLIGLQTALDGFRQHDDLNGHAWCTLQIAETLEIMGDLDTARMHYRDAQRLYKKTENVVGIVDSTTGLGTVLACQGHFEKARIELETAIAWCLRTAMDDRMIYPQSLLAKFPV